MNAPEYMALANEAEELFDVWDRTCQSCSHFVVIADSGMRHTIGFCDRRKGVSYDRGTGELVANVNDLYWATHEDDDSCGCWELSEDWA